jgi:N-acetyl-1-D-myo-inositol-2-amino-2-deoxy-alpha-D-glucopyranoside deacetylase
MRILSTVTVQEVEGGVGEVEPERVLFVHAHPDDESISTGGTIARLLDAGASVTVLTCTRGERGEIVPGELQHMGGVELGAYREAELAAAMRALHLVDHRFLGADNARAEGTGPHRFLDSGMRWGEGGAEAVPDSETRIADAGNHSDPSLTSADLDTVVADIIAVIASTAPTAVVSYDEQGGYGHPDHIRAHDAAITAALITNVPFFSIGPTGQEVEGDLVVDVSPVIERKKEALRAHRTQLTVDGDTITHSGGQREPIGTREVFRRRGETVRSGIDWTRLGWISRAAACVLALVLGSIVGAIGTANYTFALATVSLSVAALLLVGLRLLFGTRVVAASAALGLVATVLVLSQSGAGGSVLLPADDSLGYVWAYGPIVLSFLVVVWPRPGAFSRATMGEGPTSGKDENSP